jgi:hypothetical protein
MTLETCVQVVVDHAWTYRQGRAARMLRSGEALATGRNHGVSGERCERSWRVDPVPVPVTLDFMWLRKLQRSRSRHNLPLSSP